MQIKKVTIIEDAAEALGSRYKNKSLGTFWCLWMFSLAPNKIITTGQGGILVTNDKKTLQKDNTAEGSRSDIETKKMRVDIFIKVLILNLLIYNQV